VNRHWPSFNTSTWDALGAASLRNHVNPDGQILNYCYISDKALDARRQTGARMLESLSCALCLAKYRVDLVSLFKPHKSPRSDKYPGNLVCACDERWRQTTVTVLPSSSPSGCLLYKIFRGLSSSSVGITCATVPVRSVVPAVPDNMVTREAAC
jgi:hypothetical protein